MNISDGMLDTMRNWYLRAWNSEGPFGDHYLHYAKHRRGSHVIYGMDDPQQSYLALAVLCDGFRPGRRNPEETFRRFAEKATKRKIIFSDKLFKQDYDLVSNYVLDVDNSDIDLSGKPSLERSPRTDSRARRFSDRETARQDFTDRYTSSYYGIRNADPGQLLAGAKKSDAKATKYSISKLMYGYAIRRACKFLMYESIEMGRTIVYALDDLNLTAVAKMQWAHGRRGAPVQFADFEDAKKIKGFNKVPVCTTEIRELFRAWDYFSGYSCNGGYPHVVFMRNFEPCRPPWETGDQTDWAEYAVYHADKWVGTNPGVAESVHYKVLKRKADGGITLSNAASIIRAYHSLGIGAALRGDRELPHQTFYMGAAS